MADTPENDALPNYECPPVIETVLGVQFDRLARLKNAHLGAFWKSLNGENWPNLSEAPLIPTQLEQFDDKRQWLRGIQVQLSQDPACRLRITNTDGDRMIQAQNTRLHFNWLGRGEKEYPRFEGVRKGFLFAFETFTHFLASEALGDLRPNQWEVTYINHIPRGTVWETPADWGFFRLLAGLPAIASVIEGESFGGEWHFVIPDQRGRLHIEWQHGKRTPADEKGTAEFVRLTLTARGPLDGSGEDLEPIIEGLDLGRETIVRSFRALMSDTANKYWGLKK